MRRQKGGRHLFSILHVKAKPMPARTTHTCINRHGRRVLIRPTGDKRVRFLIRSADDFYTAQPITVRTGKCGKQGGRSIDGNRGVDGPQRCCRNACRRSLYGSPRERHSNRGDVPFLPANDDWFMLIVVEDRAQTLGSGV